ncbi:hypothetical protein GOODEAATRI_020557, partial [Goodea atripinnis]
IASVSVGSGAVPRSPQQGQAATGVVLHRTPADPLCYARATATRLPRAANSPLAAEYLTLNVPNSGACLQVVLTWTRLQVHAVTLLQDAAVVCEEFLTGPSSVCMLHLQSAPPAAVWCGSTHHHPTGSFETKTTVPLHPSSGLCQRASLQLGSVCSRSVQWSVSARYRRLSPASLRSLFSATLREPAAISASGT